MPAKPSITRSILAAAGLGMIGTDVAVLLMAELASARAGGPWPVARIDAMASKEPA
jgi:hypothetical protein